MIFYLVQLEEFMKKVLVFLLVGVVAQSSMAYLSRDRERLANGQGRCVVCSTGFTGPSADGLYACSVPTTVVPEGCRPAAFTLAPPVGGGGPLPGGTRFDPNGVLVKALSDGPIRSTPGRVLENTAAAPAREQAVRADAAGAARIGSNPVRACPPGVQPPCNDFGVPKLPGSPRQ